MTLAFWCVLVAALLPYVAFSFVRGLDQLNPRETAKKLAGRAARAHAAHLNAFETFPFFAAAVIISHIVEGRSAFANTAAALYILARLAHLAFYLMDMRQRSAAFTIGGLLTIAIFVQPAFS